MLTGLSHQWFRPERCASQQRNRYFLHEKYATPYLYVNVLRRMQKMTAEGRHRLLRLVRGREKP